MSDANMISRRDFLKGAAIAGAGVATGVLAPTSAAAAPVPDKWDKEADVVIVGFGGAGAVTAITAADAGAKVIILEKQAADKHTPSTMMAGGSFWAFKNAEDSFAFMKGTSMGLTPDDICRVFAEYSVKTLDWVRSIGGQPAGGGAVTEYEIPGAKSFDGSYRLPGNGRTGGENLFNFLSQNVKKRGIEIIYGTPAKDLVQTPQGEIVGVIADSQGKPLNVRAKKAVVLSCGGFEHDERMRMDFLKPYPFEFYANPGNTGDGIRMGLKVGAALWHMSSVGGRLICRWPGTPTGQIVGIGPAPYLLVGQDAKRYANEEPQAKLHHAFLYTAMEFDWKRVRYVRDPSWFIFDEKRRVAAPIPNPGTGATAIGLIPWSKDNLAEVEKGWIIKADTISELAKKIDLDPATLEKTVSTFNQYCANGKDAEFDRPKETLVPLDKPPYYAVKMFVGSWGTQGGPMRNAKCQVLDTAGKPIPRLYSAGELGSFYGQVYQGGGMLTEVIITGQIAGKSAIAEKPWGTT